MPLKKIIIFILLLLVVGVFVVIKTKKHAINDASKTCITSLRTYDAGSKKYVEISLNDIIRINEVEIVEEGNKVSLLFPCYISKNNREYPQVRILNSRLNEQIISKINDPHFEEAKYSSLNFDITKVTPYRKKNSSLKAFIAVSFNNDIEIECKILASKKRLWIAWPSRNESGRWIKQVFLRQQFKEKVEKVILSRYETLQSEAGNEWR